MSRPCVESRARAVEVVARQRRIEWSERYGIAEWQAIIASAKQRLVLIVRVQPPTRYEHLSFERIFVTWQLATTEHERRAFYSWIPEQEIRTKVLSQAVSRQWVRLTPNDSDLQLTTTWHIRHCSVRRRF